MTRVRYREGVRRLTRRSKINCTWSGRPRSRFSRNTSSKNTPPLDRSVEDLGQGELRLQDRQVIAHAGGAVRGGERMGQPRQPLAHQCVDALGVQLSGDGLHRLGVVTTRDGVVQRLEADAALGQLTLDVLVPVQTDLGVVGEIRAELHEQRSEVLVHQVQILAGLDRDSYDI